MKQSSINFCKVGLALSIFVSSIVIVCCTVTIVLHMRNSYTDANTSCRMVRVYLASAFVTSLSCKKVYCFTSAVMFFTLLVQHSFVECHNCLRKSWCEIEQQVQWLVFYLLELRQEFNVGYFV